MPQRLGRYLLTKRLGVGGMAEVFLAQQDGPAGFSKLCVVKRILPHLAEDVRFVQMFQREARVAAMLTHTNIVQIHELGEVDGIYFIAMEYVDGAPLHNLARSAWRMGRSIPLEVICCAIADAALGLHAAHTQRDVDGRPLHLVHRDISPDNLIINREGVTKILDFGIAKTAAAERTATGELKGKIPFMSPEQVMGEPLDGRADLYALGVSLYWLLTGKRPLSAQSDLLLMQRILSEMPPPPRELNPSVPEPVNDLVMQLMAKDRNARPASGADVHDALAAAVAMRRSVVAPFVSEILAAPQAPKDEAESHNAPGFLPSTPHTDELKALWKRIVDVAPARSSEFNKQLNVESAEVTLDIDVSETRYGDAPWRPPRSYRGPALAAALVGVLGAAAGAMLLLQGGEEEAEPVIAAAAPGPAPPAAAASAAAPSAAAPSAADPSAANPSADPSAVDADADPRGAAAVDLDSPAAPEPDEAEDHDAVLADPGKHRGASERREDPKRPVLPATRDLAVKAPPAIVWQTDKGKVLGVGSGTLKVPLAVKRLIAVDQRTGGRTPLPVTGAPLDWSALPHGKIQPRVNPFADVFVGVKSLGTTPFPPADLVAGSYVLRFRYDGREISRTVEVKADQTVRIAVDFTAEK